MKKECEIENGMKARLHQLNNELKRFTAEEKRKVHDLQKKIDEVRDEKIAVKTNLSSQRERIAEMKKVFELHRLKHQRIDI
jgi:formate-dependent nitrite reductase cytochrome c552 subunit